ncbi:MAG: hypothetical protein ACLSD6_02820 [Clostridium sp.]
MRLAVYEALYEESVPVGAPSMKPWNLQRVWRENGAAFVNGILGKIVNE